MNPIITFIIPLRVGQFPQKTIEKIKELNYPKNKLELILSFGTQPSWQRNEAAKLAKGEYLYFLDDDSYIDKECLNEGLKYLADPKIGAVGGAVLTYVGAPLIQQCFGEIMGSLWGGFTTRKRHKSIGLACPVYGEELILCNLLMRKDLFINFQGFSPDLYPSEEPELLKRMRHCQTTFIYNPHMKIYRPRRSNSINFFYQGFSYGRGRAKHIFHLFQPMDSIFLVPSIFVLYLLGLIFNTNKFYFIPLITYFISSLLSSTSISIQNKNIVLFLLLIPHFFIWHVSYGLGFLSGLFWKSKKSRNISNPELKIIPLS